MAKPETEKFIWVGDGMRCADELDLIGKPYCGEDGRTGRVIASSPLTITVKFDNPPTIWQRIKAWLGFRKVGYGLWEPTDSGKEADDGEETG